MCLLSVPELVWGERSNFMTLLGTSKPESKLVLYEISDRQKLGVFPCARMMEVYIFFHLAIFIPTRMVRNIISY